jgi:hypothetical protein
MRLNFIIALLGLLSFLAQPVEAPSGYQTMINICLISLSLFGMESPPPPPVVSKTHVTEVIEVISTRLLTLATTTASSASITTWSTATVAAPWGYALRPTLYPSPDEQIIAVEVYSPTRGLVTGILFASQKTKTLEIKRRETSNTPQVNKEGSLGGHQSEKKRAIPLDGIAQKRNCDFLFFFCTVIIRGKATSRKVETTKRPSSFEPTV